MSQETDLDQAPPNHFDAITVEVIRQSLVGIVQEMQNSLFCTGYSTIIRESRDASCAIADTTGRVVAQHTVLPLHLGVFPACIEHVLARYQVEDMCDGDAFVVNHPYFGGSPHATDMAVIAPVIVAGQVFGFSGSIAHKSDIGGLVPGTNSSRATEIFHEGLLLPPVRYYQRGEVVPEVETILRANSRTPELVLGDLRGQVGATRLAGERIRALCAKFGASAVHAASGRLLEQTEQLIRAAVAGWPDGIYRGERRLHCEGMAGGEPVTVRVIATIHGDEITFDFSESDEQLSGPYNIRPPLAQAVSYYALKCLIDPDLASNSGFAAAVRTVFRTHSLLDPQPPAPVNTYMPVANATAEALFDALGAAVPRARVAQSSSGTQGTLSHIVSGEHHPKVQYELPAGAMGARHTKDGVSASTVHVANGSTTPIEILESEFPVELIRFELVADSGGPGRYRGGLGYVRAYRVLAESRFTTRNGRDLTPPSGKDGGLAGKPSRLVMNPGADSEGEVLAGEGGVPLRPGNVIMIAQSGAGGYGDPLTRPVNEVLDDVIDGYVSVSAARAQYGVAIKQAAGQLVVDEAMTAQLRSLPQPSTAAASAGRFHDLSGE